MSNMACWIFVSIVTVTIAKTCDANYIEKAKANERNLRNDGNYLELAVEMRALRDTVDGQGDQLKAMEKEIESLKSEVSEQKRQYKVMETIVERQQRSVNAQRKLIEKLTRQNKTFRTCSSKVRANDGKDKPKDAENSEAVSETLLHQENQIADSSDGPSVLTKPGLKVTDPVISDNPRTSSFGDASSSGHFGYAKDKRDRQGPNVLSMKTTKAKRLVLGGGSSGQGIAFSAYLDHDVTFVATGETVKCNATLLNDGGAYDTQTGIFTAPKTGVYFFYYAIHAFHNITVIHVGLSVNNNYMVGSAIDTLDSEIHHDESSSNAAILRLSQGESAWLKAHFYTKYNAELTSGDRVRFVTFSGVLLY